MRLDPGKYINDLRTALGLPSNINKLDAGDGLTVSQTYSVLIFMQGTMGQVERVYEVAVDESAETETLASIRDEMDAFYDRLDAYRESLLPWMAEGLEDVKFALPVERPLFYGYYGKTARLPGGSPLCGTESSPGECDAKLPDASTPIRILNELDAYVDLTRDDLEELNKELLSSLAILIASAATGGTAAVSEEVVDEAARAFFDNTVGAEKNTPKPPGNDDTPPWKWALYGAGASVGLLALYKLLK